MFICCFLGVSTQLEDAAKTKNLAETESCYKDTKFLLQEVMTRMAWSWFGLYRFTCYWWSYMVDNSVVI